MPVVSAGQRNRKCREQQGYSIHCPEASWKLCGSYYNDQRDKTSKKHTETSDICKKLKKIFDRRTVWGILQIKKQRLLYHWLQTVGIQAINNDWQNSCTYSETSGNCIQKNGFILFIKISLRRRTMAIPPHIAAILSRRLRAIPAHIPWKNMKSGGWSITFLL